MTHVLMLRCTSWEAAQILLKNPRSAMKNSWASCLDLLNLVELINTGKTYSLFYSPNLPHTNEWYHSATLYLPSIMKIVNLYSIDHETNKMHTLFV